MSTSATGQDTKPNPTYPESANGKAGFARDSGRDRQSVIRREKEEFGGVKVGLAFFGWLTATGTAVMLAAFLGAAGIAVGVATSLDAGKATTQAAEDPRTVGIAGAIVLLIVLFTSFYCGGYVAARMARFHGMRQGMAVWLWALFIAALVAVLAALAGSQFDILSEMNTFPRIPVSQGTLTTGGLIALAVAATGSLAGSLIGGLAGMRFHRKVDRAGFGE
jgi:hypothetical protein